MSTEKLEAFKSRYWAWDFDSCHCRKHNTYFDSNIEPCWQCLNECDECEEEDDGRS